MQYSIAPCRYKILAIIAYRVWKNNLDKRRGGGILKVFIKITLIYNMNKFEKPKNKIEKDTDKEKIKDFEIQWEWNSDSLSRSPFSLECADGEFKMILHPCPSSDESKEYKLTREEMKKELEKLSYGLRRYEYDSSADKVMAEARDLLHEFGPSLDEY